MAWFNADDRLHSHPKARKAGLEAMGLWVVSGTYCSNYKTDGFVPDYYVNSWPKGARLAARLVDSMLWEMAPDGYRFLSWPEYQRTKEQIEAAKAEHAEASRTGGKRSAHTRWHVNKGRLDPACPYCRDPDKR